MSLIIHNNYGQVNHIENSNVTIGSNGSLVNKGKLHSTEEAEVVQIEDISSSITTEFNSVKTPTDAGICAVHKAKICNKADWAAVVKILEEREEMQKGAYSADAEYINRICGEEVTNANSISRSPIFTKIVGEYPNWSVRPSEQNRETAGKLQTYLEIGKIFTDALER